MKLARMVGALTVKRTCSPPSPRRRGFPLKLASSAEAVHFCRSRWGRSYLSSWLASSARNRKSGRTHTDVICNQSRKRGGLWIYLGGCTRRHQQRVCVCVAFSGTSPTSHQRLNWHETGMTAKSHTARHPSNRVHLGKHAYGDGGVKYVILEQLAQFSPNPFPHKSFTITVINTNWVRKWDLIFFSPRYSRADSIC